MGLDHSISISLNEEEKELFEESIDIQFQPIYTNITESPIAPIMKVLRSIGPDDELLITTADNILIQSVDVEYLLKQRDLADFLIGVVNGHDGLCSSYPAMKEQRTWHKLNKKTWLSGANLFYFAKKNFSENKLNKIEALLLKWESNRKKPLNMCLDALQKTLPHIPFLIKYILQLTNYDEASEFISAATDMRVKLVPVKSETACIDLDKIEDYYFIENYLKEQLTK